MRNTSKPRLRVGFLIDDLRVPAWAYEVIRAICVSGCFRPALVLLAGNPRRTRGFLRRSPDCALSLLEAFYFKLDEIVFRPRPDAFEPISASELLKGVTTKLLTAGQGCSFRRPRQFRSPNNNTRQPGCPDRIDRLPTRERSTGRAKVWRVDLRPRPAGPGRRRSDRNSAGYLCESHHDLRT